jgi:hypothetical protein
MADVLLRTDVVNHIDAIILASLSLIKNLAEHSVIWKCPSLSQNASPFP